jgi:hypothetical protein
MLSQCRNLGGRPRHLRPAGMLGIPCHYDYQSECDFYVPNMAHVTSIMDLRALDNQTRREKTEENSKRGKHLVSSLLWPLKFLIRKYYRNSVKEAGRLNWQSPRMKGHIYSNYL